MDVQVLRAQDAQEQPPSLRSVAHRVRSYDDAAISVGAHPVRDRPAPFVLGACMHTRAGGIHIAPSAGIASSGSKRASAAASDSAIRRRNSVPMPGKKRLASREPTASTP